MNKSVRGFTLIELLVVIAIIGILSSVVLASLSSARARGRDAVRQSDVRQLQNALELYYNDANRYPAVSGAAQASELQSTLVPSYISVIPSDPSGAPAQYQYYSGPPYTGYTIVVDYEGDSITRCRIDVGGGYTPWAFYPPC